MSGHYLIVIEGNVAKSKRKIFGGVNSGVVIEENIECQGEAFNDMIILINGVFFIEGGDIFGSGLVIGSGN